MHERYAWPGAICLALASHSLRMGPMEGLLPIQQEIAGFLQAALYVFSAVSLGFGSICVFFALAALLAADRSPPE